jgi:hypothetical protein
MALNPGEIMDYEPGSLLKRLIDRVEKEQDYDMVVRYTDRVARFIDRINPMHKCEVIHGS